MPVSRWEQLRYALKLVPIALALWRQYQHTSPPTGASHPASWSLRFYLLVRLLRHLLEQDTVPALNRHALEDKDPRRFYWELLRVRQLMETRPSAMEAVEKELQWLPIWPRSRALRNGTLRLCVWQDPMPVPDLQELLLEVCPDVQYPPCSRPITEWMRARLSPNLPDLQPLHGEWVHVETPASTARSPCSSTVILYLHGGAYTSMSAESMRGLAARIAKETGCIVFSLNYHLAPIHPYPIPLLDVLAAYIYLLRTRNVPSSSIVWMGDSAGGGLALGALLFLRDHGCAISQRLGLGSHGVPMPAGCVLFSPWGDVTLSLDSVRANDPYDFLMAFNGVAGDKPVLKPGLFYYLGMDAIPVLGNANLEKQWYGHLGYNPYICPSLSADLTFGLPPLYIQVGSVETLLSDSLALFFRAQPKSLQSKALANALTFQLCRRYSDHRKIPIPRITNLQRFALPPYLHRLLNQLEPQSHCVRVEIFADMVHEFQMVPFLKASRVAFQRAGWWIHSVCNRHPPFGGLYWIDGISGDVKHRKK